MISTRLLSAAIAASLISLVAAADSSSSSILLIPSPTTQVPLAAQTTVGCFATSVPLEDHGPYQFQSEGNCQGICVGLGMPVMGLVDGTNCWCGEYLPPADSEVDMKENCDTPCQGIDTHMCGGNKKWLIVLTGMTKNKIPHWNQKPASSSSSIAPTSKSSSTTVPATVIVTASETPTEEPKKSSGGPNKAGIAAGVVVGVVGLAAIIGGVMFYLRQRRRKEIEEEYRRQAAVNSFVAGNSTSNSSMTDSRLDPEFMMRRSSNGSIADNEDYSRRILKVTNPDGN
ncbi:hypothetical protein GQ43DRAFT_65719 [Delitschia confertaspora ATCC 74209]|uniref:WSC domain-containing protein n=1 Tax=Delitschia confertaspora ATCC 74209 TaxID=1513339 RepID=A0A9P4JJL1_9PLEO|nr:hypothetical protein GQ43DRAFT_65719 [Delitschia confertaspora ATCC 74209]